MAYGTDLRGAARRHNQAASVLHEHAGAGSQPGCLAVAGYLFGIAGELAVKELMRKSGMRELSKADRRHDPFFAHFPELKKMLSTAHGRNAEVLRKVSQNQGLFRNWEIGMRYAPTVDIQETWVSEWRGSAKELIDRMESE